MKIRISAVLSILLLVCLCLSLSAFAEEDTSIIDVIPAPPAEDWSAPTVFVGSSMMFGSYEQNGNLYDGPEPIEWLVLDIRGDDALLISRWCLTGQRFNTTYAKATWETSPLRAWLNGEFLTSAFSDTERQQIRLTWVDNSQSQSNPSWTSANTGADTQDSVFLLSWAEAERFFGSDEARKTYMTQAAGTQKYQEAGVNAWWWLRSMGKSNLGVSIVRGNGTMTSQHINEDTGGVRPVIWIHIEQQTPAEEIIY